MEYHFLNRYTANALFISAMQIELSNVFKMPISSQAIIRSIFIMHYSISIVIQKGIISLQSL